LLLKKVAFGVMFGALPVVGEPRLLAEPSSLMEPMPTPAEMVSEPTRLDWAMKLAPENPTMTSLPTVASPLALSSEDVFSSTRPAAGVEVRALHVAVADASWAAVAVVTVFQKLYVPEPSWIPQGMMLTPLMTCGPVVNSEVSCARVRVVTGDTPL